MNKLIRITFLLILLLAIAWPGVVYAKDLYEDKVVFGGVFTLDSGETLNGNLIVFGGVATLEQDSLVNGDVILFGGSLEVGGEVNGEIIGLGGFVELTEYASVTGDVITLGANLDQAVGADIQGDIINGISGPLPLPLVIPGGVQIPNIGLQFNPVFDFLWFLFRMFLWSFVAVLLVLFLPKQVDRTARTAFSQPIIAGGLGLLTAILVPVVVVVLFVTICLIPVGLLLLLGLVIAWGFGLIALGLEVGRRIAGMLKREWAPGVSAGVGTFVLILVLDGLRLAIPCLGWVFLAIAGMVGLGAILLTRFGTQEYPAEAELPPAPPAPPMPPQVDTPQIETESAPMTEVEQQSPDEQADNPGEEA